MAEPTGVALGEAEGVGERVKVGVGVALGVLLGVAVSVAVLVGLAVEVGVGEVSGAKSKTDMLYAGKEWLKDPDTPLKVLLTGARSGLA